MCSTPADAVQQPHKGESVSWGCRSNVPHPGGLNSRHLFPQCSGGWKLHPKVLTGLVSPEAHPLVSTCHLVPVSSHGLLCTRLHPNTGCQSYQSGPILGTSLNLNHLFKALTSKYSLLLRCCGVRTSTYELVQPIQQ